MKNNTYLLIGILIFLACTGWVIQADAQMDFHDRKLAKVEDYNMRQIDMETLIHHGMKAGMSFEEAYLRAKLMHTTPLFISETIPTQTLDESFPKIEPLTDENNAIQNTSQKTDQKVIQNTNIEKIAKTASKASPLNTDYQLSKAEDMATDYRQQKIANTKKNNQPLQKISSQQLAKINNSYPIRTEQAPDEMADYSYYRDIAINNDEPSSQENTNIRDLTIEEINKNSKFDKNYQEAIDHDYSRRNFIKDNSLSDIDSINITEMTEPYVSHTVHSPESAVMTPEEIIRQVITQENRAKKMDLNFDQTNLGDVMMTMGETGGINIVLDPTLYQNKLDLHLKQVSLEEAMMLLSNIYNMGFEKVGDSLFVAPKEKLSDRKIESRVVKLRNISVNDAKLLVKDLAVTINASEELNSLVLMGSPEQLIKIEEVLAKVDVPQPQVLIEAKILEINKDALKDLGVDWSSQINLQYQETKRPQSFDSEISGSVSSVFDISEIARNAIQFESTIKMLENQSKARILSNPRVTTLNGKEAEIFVGDKLPYTITNVTGGVVTTDVRFVEPGIRLKITPSIIDQDFVILKVDPEVSFIFAFRGPNNEFPQVKTREATAHVRVKNRTPFVIGGLLNQEDKQSLSKVPFLGEIPLLGNLFTYQNNSVTDTELIITILPTIVTGSMQ